MVIVVVELDPEQLPEGEIVLVTTYVPELLAARFITPVLALTNVNPEGVAENKPG